MATERRHLFLKWFRHRLQRAHRPRYPSQTTLDFTLTLRLVVGVMFATSMVLATWSCEWIATLHHDQNAWVKRLDDNSLFNPPAVPTLEDFMQDFDSVPVAKVTDADIDMTPQWFGVLIELFYFWAAFCSVLCPLYFVLRSRITDRFLHVVFVSSACSAIVTVPSAILIWWTGSLGGPHLFILTIPLLALGLIVGFATMPDPTQRTKVECG
ncbi:hypothetical protein [Novipirellula caenicola]|uniref:Transmembrane protein n=1 Tax=Novipirellula caenicola TaxID=1536901 RepID=A0ABP9VHC6_9BACT